MVLPQERLQDVFTYGGYCFHCAGRDIPAGSAFAYGVPEFKLWPIFLMTIFCIINMIQCIGVFSVMDEIADVETENEIKERGSAGRQVAQMITGAFNSVPSTMFNENVSLIGFNKDKEPFGHNDRRDHDHTGRNFPKDFCGIYSGSQVCAGRSYPGLVPE